jgi:hypothetical protein
MTLGANVMSESYTLKTRELLAAQGIRCAEGKEVVPCGKNPDLFCTEPHPLWVEVKYIKAPQQFERSGPLIERLDRALKELNGNGSIFVHVSNACYDTDIKLARQALIRLANR